MSELITVAIFQYPHEAYVIKSKLESEGIQVLLKDELTIQSHAFLSNAIGGVKLQIYESDMEKAYPILSNAGLLNNVAHQPSVIAQFFVNTISSIGDFVNTKRTKFLKYWPVLLVIPITFILIVLLFPQLWSEDKSYPQVDNKAYTEIVPTKNVKTFEIYRRANEVTEDSISVLSDPEKAISKIKKLLIEHPGNRSLENQIGNAYFDIDSVRLALLHWRSSIKGVESENLNFLFEMVLLKLQLKDYNGAIEDLKIAANFDWNYNFNLGQVYMLKNDLRNAEIYYTKYLYTNKKNNDMIVFDSAFIELQERVEGIREELRK